MTNHQNLVIPAVTHQLIEAGHGKKPRSGAHTVAANQLVIVDIPKGKQLTKGWPRGSHEYDGGVQRFGVATASTTVAVVPIIDWQTRSTDRASEGA